MDLTAKVSLKCGVCGNTNFEYDDAIFISIEEAEQLKCTVSNKVYTREDLMKANTTLINNTTKEMAEEVLGKELKKLGFKVKIK